MIAGGGPLLRALSRLSTIVARLTVLNHDLLARAPVAGDPVLAAALEERAAALEEWQAAGDEAAQAVAASAGGGATGAGPLDWLDWLARCHDPEIRSAAVAYRVALATLVETDAAVLGQLQTVLDTMRREIGAARNAGKKLRGYVPIESFDSCFIDRRK